MGFHHTVEETALSGRQLIVLKKGEIRRLLVEIKCAMAVNLEMSMQTNMVL